MMINRWYMENDGKPMDLGVHIFFRQTQMAGWMTYVWKDVGWHRITAPNGLEQAWLWWWVLKRPRTQYVFYGLFPKNTIFNGKITMFNGKIHYFDWAIFNSKLLVYQRVNIPWFSLAFNHPCDARFRWPIRGIFICVLRCFGRRRRDVMLRGKTAGLHIFLWCMRFVQDIRVKKNRLCHWKWP